MAYDRTRVNLTEEEHVLAKEWNELFEALVDDADTDTKVSEAIGAVMATLSNLATTKNGRLRKLLKVAVANVLDEVQQRYILADEE
jgi:hypothetical protein